MDKRTQNTALAALDAKDQLDRLEGPLDTVVPLPFTTLYRAATDAAFPLPDDFNTRLAAHAKSRKIFEDLLREQMRFFVPRAAAAASGRTTRRETEKLTLSVIASKSKGGQSYVLLQMKNSFDEAPRQLTAVTADGQIFRVQLPLFDNASAQIVLEQDDPLLAALVDPDTEILMN